MKVHFNGKAIDESNLINLQNAGILYLHLN